MAPGAVGLNQAPSAVQYDDNGEILPSPAQQRVLDKQSEWEGFLKLLRQTEVQQQYMSELADKTNLMSDGTAGEQPFKCSSNARTPVDCDSCQSWAK